MVFNGNKLYFERMNIMKTLKNKLAALALVGCGLVPTILEGDASVLLFAIVFGLPLFFAKDDCFGD